MEVYMIDFRERDVILKQDRGQKYWEEGEASITLKSGE